MKDQTVLITGGTGSFGQAFCRVALDKGARQVRIYSRDELKQAVMKAAFNDPRIEFLCGDVRDAERLERATEGATVVVHASAMKRVEKCEHDPEEAIKTNILGTLNVIKASLKCDVKAAVLISTDKAVYPINLYGTTKLAAEKCWIQANVYRGTTHPTRFSVVRYGNVLGSRGSVLHIFKDCVERGEKLCITNPEMTRFFITLQQATDLVELALETAQGGEIFIPELKAVSILRLALAIGKGLPVEITSQRGGEKLHESLLISEEIDRCVSYEHYSIINPEAVNVTWPYQPWTSEIRRASMSSSVATQFTDKELKGLLASIS